MSNPATFINVIDVDPSKQQELIDVLLEGAGQVISQRPGFLSVRVLASLDGSRVVNIAEWASAGDAKATQSDPAAADYARRAAALGRPSPGVYAVVGEFSA